MTMQSIHTTRRALLAGMAGTAQAAPAQIVDTHTHFYDPARPQGVPWPPKTDPLLYRTVLPADFRKVSSPFGVTGTVVVEASAWVEDNQWILDMAKTDKTLMGLVGHLEPNAPDFAANLERFHKNKLFLGIRLGAKPIADCLSNPAMLANVKRLADANLMLDAIGQPEVLEHVARLSDRIPSLRIVIDHLPYQPPKMLAELSKRPRVYAKVSGGLPSKEALDELWQVFGEDRLIYGSNWPVSDRVAPYGAIFKHVRAYFAGKGREASEKYFWKNSQLAYRWGAR
jgi:L-fuconolactonase